MTTHTRLGALFATFTAVGLAGAVHAHTGHDWEPNLQVVQYSPLQSKSLKLTWDEDFGDCGTPSAIKRIMIRKNLGTSSPAYSSKGAGDFVAYVDVGVKEYKHMPLYSDQDYAYTVYACTNDNMPSDPCTEICPDVDAAHAEESGQTAKEKWVLQGISNYSDTSRVLDSSTLPASTPYAVQIPDVDGDYDGHVFLYVRHGDGIFWLENSCSDWDSDWTNPGGSCSWSSPVKMLGITDGGDYQNLTNPTGVLTKSGSTSKIRMFFTATDIDEDENTDNYRIFWIDSDDLDTISSSDHFNTDCTSPCTTTECTDTNPYTYCDYDAVTVTSVIDAGSGNYLKDGLGWHGRIAFDDVAADFDPSTDELFMLFTAKANGVECAESGNDDINVIEYDTGVFSLLEEQDTGGDWCPKDVRDSRHDPAVLPYPTGEYKVYVEQQQLSWWVQFTDDGETFTEKKDVQFFFDDESTSVDDGCIDDPVILVHDDGTIKHELMLFTTHSGSSDTGDGDPECFSDGGVAAAVLSNG